MTSSMGPRDRPASQAYSFPKCPINAHILGGAFVPLLLEHLISFNQGLQAVPGSLWLCLYRQDSLSQFPWVGAPIGPRRPCWAFVCPGGCLLPWGQRRAERESQSPVWRPWLDIVGLFPHHTPGSDRNVLSPCPAHPPLSWKALNSSHPLLRCLFPLSSPCFSLEHAHASIDTHMMVHTGTHKYTGAQGEVTQILRNQGKNTGPWILKPSCQQAYVKTATHVCMNTQRHT